VRDVTKIKRVSTVDGRTLVIVDRKDWNSYIGFPEVHNFTVSRDDDAARTIYQITVILLWVGLADL